jgi:hypothetical protein
MLHVAEGAEGFLICEIMNLRESVRAVIAPPIAQRCLEASNGG